MLWRVEGEDNGEHATMPAGGGVTSCSGLFGVLSCFTAAAALHYFGRMRVAVSRVESADLCVYSRLLRRECERRSAGLAAAGTAKSCELSLNDLNHYHCAYFTVMTQ